RAAGVAEAELAEPALEVHEHFVDGLARRVVAFQLDVDAGGQAVVQRRRAVEVDFDVVLEGADLAIVARAAPGVIAADLDAGRGPVEAAERQFDRIGRLGLPDDKPGGDQCCRTKEYVFHCLSSLSTAGLSVRERPIDRPHFRARLATCGCESRSHLPARKREPVPQPLGPYLRILRRSVPRS